MQMILAIMIGGAFGAAARYLVATGMVSWLGRDFPYATITVNILGSFLTGLLTMLLLQRFSLDPLLKAAILVGFLGAFTTFSTFSLDAFSLFEQGAHFKALAYILSSVVACIVALWLGMLLGKQL